MADGFFFGGQFYITPTTVGSVDDSAESPSNLTIGNTLAIIGVCDGGKPGQVYSFGSPDQATAALVSGPLCDACVKAFNPSDEVNAPNLVKALRVGSSSPSIIELLDSDGAASIIASSTAYGVTLPPPRIKVEHGTNPGTLKLSIAQGQNYVVRDNLGGYLLSASYNGLAASAAVTISDNILEVQAPLNTVIGTLPFTQYTVVQDLVDFVNTFTGFAASPANGLTQYLVFNAMDNFGAVLKGADGISNGTVSATANIAAIVQWMNSGAQTFVTGVAAPMAANPPVPIPWTYLAGGITPAIALADYVNGLEILQGIDLQWLAVLSGDPAVHAATDAHVQYMSTVGRKERRAFVGPNAGTSMTQAMALPINLNSDRTAICWPGYYDYNTTGQLVLRDPFYLAAIVAAGFAGSSPGTPMTNKAITVRGIETPIRNPTDTDQLIQSGLLTFDLEPDGYKIVRSISTWLVNNNFNRVEISTGAATDYMVATVRAALNVLKGSRGDPRVLGRAMSITQTALSQLAVPPPIGPGVIVGDAANPAFRNIRASLTGDALTVTFEASPVIPLNFIGIAISIVPYSGTASA